GCYKKSTKHRSCFVQRLRIVVAGLYLQAGPCGLIADAGLQGMITGMRLAADETLRTVASDWVAGGIESSERRECRIGSAIAIGRIDTRQMNAYGRNIGSACAQVAEAVIDSQPVTAD